MTQKLSLFKWKNSRIVVYFSLRFFFVTMVCSWVISVSFICTWLVCICPLIYAVTWFQAQITLILNLYSWKYTYTILPKKWSYQLYSTNFESLQPCNVISYGTYMHLYIKLKYLKQPSNKPHKTKYPSLSSDLSVKIIINFCLFALEMYR